MEFGSEYEEDFDYGEYHEYFDYHKSGSPDVEGYYGMDMECRFYGKKYVKEDPIRVGGARVPVSILQAIAAAVYQNKAGYTQETMRELLPRVWMRAIGQIFPETPLAKLRSKDPSLLPHWLLERFDDYQVHYTRNLIPK
jgi:hypothetical protein